VSNGSAKAHEGHQPVWLNGSCKEETEEGESGAAQFIGTTGCPPSDTESTVLLDFVVAMDVSGRCRAFLMRSSSSSFPPVQSENPLFCAAGEWKAPAAGKWLS
jgi:hypothetical protein